MQIHRAEDHGLTRNVDNPPVCDKRGELSRVLLLNWGEVTEMSVNFELELDVELQSAVAVAQWLAYMAVQDRQIHNAEFTLIQEFLASNEIENEDSDSVFRIFRVESEINDVDSLIESIGQLGPDVRDRALRLGILIAHADGYFDPREDSLLLKACNYWRLADCYEMLKEEMNHFIAESSPDSTESELGNFLSMLNRPSTRKLLRLIGRYSPKTISHRVHALHNRLLVSGENYDEAILNCRKITDASLRFVEPILQQHANILNELSSRVEALKRENLSGRREEDEVNNAVNQFLLDVKSVIQSLELRSNHLLESKRRTRNHYTIAFMGKTKAGKSTLHAVVTKSSSSQIGVGRQRTTRYNWVYNWKNIRMIDTPGIGAPGGESDEEIARSIVDEADVIVYLVKNDSVQETEFRFLTELSQKNKPLIILLNIKENLTDPTRLSKFLSDPDKIYTRQDHKSLDGHIERIKRYVEEHYEHTHFDVIPVQLLAALLAADKTYAKYSAKLYRASHVQSFLDSLRVAIIEDGPLRRIQNIVNGTYLVLEDTRSTLNNHLNTFRVLQDKLSEGKERVERAIYQQAETSKHSLVSVIKQQFRKLESGLYTFAMENYFQNKEDLQVSWERHLTDLNIQEGIRKSVETEYEIFRDAVKQYVKELGEDLGAWYKSQEKHFRFQTKSSFSMHIVLDIANLLVTLSVAGLGIAALLGAEIAMGPIGWVAAGVTVGLLILKKAFKSKDKKRKEAVDHLYQQLKKAVTEMEQETLSAIIDRFDDVERTIHGSVVHFHLEMGRQLGHVIAEIEPAEVLMATSLQELSRVYAWQLIGLESGRSFDLDEIPVSDVKRDVLYVERPTRNELIVKTSLDLSPTFMKDLSQKLQMKIQTEPVRISN